LPELFNLLPPLSISLFYSAVRVDEDQSSSQWTRKFTEDFQTAMSTLLPANHEKDCSFLLSPCAPSAPAGSCSTTAIKWRDDIRLICAAFLGSPKKHIPSCSGKLEYIPTPSSPVAPLLSEQSRDVSKLWSLPFYS